MTGVRSAADVEPTPLLLVDELKVLIAASGRDVVREVSFTVNRGEVLGLVGESGSGKTTVALALMGHARRGLTIAGGSVRLNGEEVLGRSKPDLRRMRGGSVAYVAQDPTSALNPALKVGTQLREVFAAHPGALRDGASIGDRISELLADVRLDSVASALDSYPHQLSGGQQQRAMLAMAFACRPQLIILDEPTTGLDVTTQRHVLDTIRRLCATYHVGAVYVSHDLAVVADIADAAGVMYAGRLVEFGPVHRVLEAPAHPYTRGLIRAIPSPDRAHVLEGIEGQPPRPGARPIGCFFSPRCQFRTSLCEREFPAPVPSDASKHWARCFRADEVAQLPPLDALPTRHRESGTAARPLLEVQHLSARYGDKVVLREVQMAVRPQQCVAIVGESGAGKTTFARCVVGLHAQWTGAISFDGGGLSAKRRRRSREHVRALQYVFQNPYTSLNPRKTVGELVEQPLRELFHLSRREREGRVGRALEDAALGISYNRRYPDQLSGGERQRVAIARALVVEPKLLVCDEVTSALDVSVQAAVVELLHELKATRGLTLVLITHNLAVVRSLADEVVILRDGLIVERGAGVLDNPQSDYAAQLLADVPKLRVTMG